MRLRRVVFRFLLLLSPCFFSARSCRTSAVLLRDANLQDWLKYLKSDACTMSSTIFLRVAAVILKEGPTWLQYGSSSTLRHKLVQAMDNKNKEAVSWLVIVTCRLLAFLGFGQF